MEARLTKRLAFDEGVMKEEPNVLFSGEKDDWQKGLYVGISGYQPPKMIVTNFSSDRNRFCNHFPQSTFGGKTRRRRRFIVEFYPLLLFSLF